MPNKPYALLHIGARRDTTAQITETILGPGRLLCIIVVAWKTRGDGTAPLNEAITVLTVNACYTQKFLVNNSYNMKTILIPDGQKFALICALQNI